MLKITIFNEETHEASTIDNIEACVLLTKHEEATSMRAEGGGKSLFKIVSQWEEFGRKEVAELVGVSNSGDKFTKAWNSLVEIGEIKQVKKGKFVHKMVN